jgi:hypothetical protein
MGSDACQQLAVRTLPYPHLNAGGAVAGPHDIGYNCRMGGRLQFRVDVETMNRLSCLVFAATLIRACVRAYFHVAHR